MSYSLYINCFSSVGCDFILTSPTMSFYMQRPKVETQCSFVAVPRNKGTAGTDYTNVVCTGSKLLVNTYDKDDFY